MTTINRASSIDQRQQQVETQINVTGTYIAGDEAYDVRGLANPYLGLAAFTYTERDRYAGRAAEVKQALHLLTTPGNERPLLFITGASGSGKSSFAQAGLLPALEAHYEALDYTVHWVVFRPGEQPLAGTARALRALNRSATGIFAPAAPYMIGSSPEPADENQIAILIIDQFEEIFTQSEISQGATLLDMLTALPAFQTGRLHVITTMRADYLRELFEFPALYDLAKRGIDLRAMDEDALKVAIQRPLQAMHPNSGKRFQKALLNELAQDATKDAALLPLLQVTLDDLWRIGILTADNYANLTDAIRERADTIFTYKTLPTNERVARTAAEQTAILNLLLDLVDVALDDTSQRDVRRTRRLPDVVRGRRAIKQLLEELVTARLLIADEKRLDGDENAVETVEIIHESLIVNWPRLFNAVSAQREKLQQRRRFELRLDEWLENERATSYLLTGVYLAEAEKLHQENDVAVQAEPARALITQSLRHRQQRQRRILQVTAAVAVALGFFAIGAVIAGLIAIGQRDRAAQEATKNRAQSLLFAAQETTDGELRLRLALEAVQTSRQRALFPPPEAIRELLAAYVNAPIISEPIAADFASSVSGVTFDPDGRWIALQRGMNYGTGQLYDWHRREVAALPPETAGTNYFHFIPNSDLLIADAWPLLHMLKRVDLSHHCSFPHGKRWTHYQTVNAEAMLVLTADEHSLQIWDAKTCMEVSRVTFTVTNRSAPFFNRHQTQFFLLQDNMLYQWDMNAPASPITLEAITVTAIVHNVARTKLLLYRERDVVLLDTVSGTIEPTALDPKQPPRGYLSPDGRFLLSYSLRTRTWTLWRVAEGTTIRMIKVEGDLHESRWISRPSGDIFVIPSTKQVRLYQAETGDLLPSPPMYRGATEIRHVEVHPKGQWLMIDLKNRLGQDVIEVWDIETAALLAEYGFRGGFVRSSAYSPDGEHMAILGGIPNILQLWNLPVTEKTIDLFARAESIFALAKSSESEVQIRNVTANQAFTTPTLFDNVLDLSMPIQSAGLVVDHQCDDDWGECTVYIWDVSQDSTRPLHTFVCDDVKMGCPLRGNFDNVQISPDGRLLAVRGYSDSVDDLEFFGHQVALWDLNQGIRLPILRHHVYVEAMGFSPTQPQLAVMGSDGTVSLWSLDATTPSSITWSLSESGVAAYPPQLTFTPDGTKLIWNTWDENDIGGLRVMDLVAGKQLNAYHPNVEKGDSGIESFHVTPDGNTLVVLLQGYLPIKKNDKTFEPLLGQQIQRWNLQTFEPIGNTIDLKRRGINDIAFLGNLMGDHHLMATAGDDGLARVWQLTREEIRLLMEIPHPASVQQVIFAPSGQRLITVDAAQTRHSWPLNFSDPDSVYGIIQLACERLRGDFTDGEWFIYMGEQPRGMRPCTDDGFNAR